MSGKTGLNLLSSAYDSLSEDEEFSEISSISASSGQCGSSGGDISFERIAQETLASLIEQVVVNEKSGRAGSARNNSRSFVNFRAGKNEDEIDLSSEDSESSSSDSDDNVDGVHSDDHENVIDYVKEMPRTKGELGIEDLPPLEKLSIEAPVEYLVHVGRVKNIMDRLVTIQSFKSMPALDLDSVLFLKNGQALGAIFEVFGPVVEPMYMIRFNTCEDIIECQVAVDMPVYFASNFQAPITAYVFVEQLRKLKGSDASWKHNNEPPDEVKEYSDDDEERKDKQKHRSKRKNNSGMPRGEFDNPIPRNNGYASPSSILAPPNTPANSYHQPHGNWFNSRRGRRN